MDYLMPQNHPQNNADIMRKIPQITDLDMSETEFIELLEYSMIQYNNLFGKEDQISSFFYLDRKKDDQHK